MNRVQLRVILSEVHALRYTPAGISVLDLVLAHQSEVVEAGHPRQLDFEFEARAIGEIAEALSTVELGSFLDIEGFLTTTRKNSRRVLLHIQRFTRQASNPIIV
ncbi:MAG: primosomal replication protein N [Alcaligenaceae bacterium]|nr:primosomal replication protein N [Alcaligenaceae bacterium]